MAFSKKEDVEALSAALNEPAWVLDRRLQAWDWFQKMELPHEKDEPWRYTNLAQLRFKLDAFSPRLPDANPAPETEAEAHVCSGRVVQRDGSISLAEVDGDLESKGVIFTDLSTAITRHPELVQKYLFSQVGHEGHIFNALHAAFFSGGSFLYVPKGVSIAAPFASTRWIDQAGSASFPHTLIVAEEGAEVTHLERFRSPRLDSDSLSSGASEIFAAPASHVTSVVLQQHSSSVWHFQTQRAVADRDVHFTSALVTLGGKFSRQEIGSRINGPGVSIDMLGLYFASKGQHFDFRTLQDHASDHSTSDLLYKGALRDDAHTVYSGLIHVRTNGAETDAYQTNRNLVLSDHAKADSKPELEIENNDVRCSHAASVGQLNEEEIFYLVSRGIAREAAQQLIVNGFFEEVVGRIRQESIREILSPALAEKIGMAGALAQ